MEEAKPELRLGKEEEEFLGKAMSLPDGAGAMCGSVGLGELTGLLIPRGCSVRSCREL